MLPVGAYVTYEHEYILVLRKGVRRQFLSPTEKANRRESAFFWEERNIWFSDIWRDIKGVSQALGDTEARARSAAFPFELAYRLICMFSVKNDTVLDPFVGTGTTLAAALVSGRNAIGVEIDESLVKNTHATIGAAKDFANIRISDRFSRHIEFVTSRTTEKGPLKHINSHYGFPVMTGQEQDLLLNEVLTVTSELGETIEVTYSEAPQPNWVRNWTIDELAGPGKPRSKTDKPKRSPKAAPAVSETQVQLDFQKS